jgi:hypothetical protein
MYVSHETSKKFKYVKVILLITASVSFMLSLYDLQTHIDGCKIIYLMRKTVLIVIAIMEPLCRLCANKIKMEHSCKANSVK